MRQFYYKIESTRRRAMGGTINKVGIFSSNNNKLTRIGETSWNTASYKGNETEVLSVLIEKGLVDKKFFKGSNNIADGYYTWDAAEKAGIKIEEI